MATEVIIPEDDSENNLSIIDEEEDMEEHPNLLSYGNQYRMPEIKGVCSLNMMQQ
jgi:hypothetical protein